MNSRQIPKPTKTPPAASSELCTVAGSRLERIAERVHRLTSICVAGFRQSNIEVTNTTWFDTIVIRVGSSREIHQRALKHNILLREIDDMSVGISFDETSNLETVKMLFDIFQVDADISKLDQSVEP